MQRTKASTPHLGAVGRDDPHPLLRYARCGGGLQHLQHQARLPSVGQRVPRQRLLGASLGGVQEEHAALRVQHLRVWMG